MNYFLFEIFLIPNFYILVIDQVKNDIEKLKQLIDNHEVVFLLMDTRESRWLPTLLAAVNNKV